MLVSINAFCQSKSVQDDMTHFQNREQIVYCLQLPLHEYLQPQSPVKAAFVFKNKKDRSLKMSVQGFFKTAPDERFEQYIDSRYTKAAHTPAKSILKSEMNKTSGCYYELYYLQNSAKAFRMLEMIWVRSEDVVILKVKFPVKALGVWMQRIDRLIKMNSHCEPDDEN